MSKWKKKREMKQEKELTIEDLDEVVEPIIQKRGFGRSHSSMMAILIQLILHHIYKTGSWLALRSYIKLDGVWTLSGDQHRRN